MASLGVCAHLAKRLEGKVALITGGALEVGAATTKLFCQHGAKVVVADVYDQIGQALCDGIGPDAAYVHCNPAAEDDVSRAVDFAVERFGKLDVMFNNATVLDNPKPHIVDNTVDDFQKVMAVNVTGVFLGTKHAARVMVPAGRGGVVINTGSVGSEIGGIASHAYIASKHAVAGLTKNAAAELGKHGIRVNCISPFIAVSSLAGRFFGKSEEELRTWIEGLGNLKGRVLRAEDVAEAALFIASDEANYVSGHNFVLDGGFSTVNHAFGFFSH
ncbi:hypothetical protein Taro_046468 [Colocasia esculenta]|uniref:Uncharacterized protein n=1 Tax=Colocasia esculenta TaxID=4460 RepID=A0A843WZ92_COLES|nr:hypothetical protein [Colocasia esculenta]